MEGISNLNRYIEGDNTERDRNERKKGEEKWSNRERKTLSATFIFEEYEIIYVKRDKRGKKRDEMQR